MLITINLPYCWCEYQAIFHQAPEI